MNLMRRSAICAVVMVALLACDAGLYAKPLLRQGERMVFLGDSITQQLIYSRYVMNYFTLRYPGSDITFRNAGWSGDTAPGGLGRLQRDVLALKPNVVSICFGMNDAGYKDFDLAGFKEYMTGMTGLVTELKKARAKVVLLTPGCVQARNPASRYNATLGLFAKGVANLAASEHVPVYDIHSLMLDIRNRALALDPKFMMIPDQIHPNDSGHAIMAYGLLRAMGCDEQPSGLKIDARNGRIRADRCKIFGLKILANTVSFTRIDAALPTSFDSDASATFAFFPIIQELDYYPLSIAGLKTGNWKLVVQGIDIGTFSANDLEAGVNLATMPGPWQILGEKVNRISSEQEELYFKRWRTSLWDVPKGGEAERQALLKDMDKSIQEKERARIDATARRDWQWTLTMAP